MKVIECNNGSTLYITENEADEDQMAKEFPSPFIYRKAREIDAELKNLDNNIDTEIEAVPMAEKGGVQYTLYTRDRSIFPPRVQQWRVERQQLTYDNSAKLFAEKVFNYWTKSRARRNGAQG